MKKRERIRAEIEKLSERRKQIDARIKTLEQQYKEEEMMDYVSQAPQVFLKHPGYLHWCKDF